MPQGGNIKRKLCVYIDESGQDTKGELFLVSVLILEKDREIISEKLGEIEKESGRKNSKWNQSHHRHRKKYIESLLKIKEIENKIFFDIFNDTKEYIKLTSFTTAKAILKKSFSNYKATIFVDGLKKKEIELFSRGLRDLRIKTRKIRGVKKDENNVYIRLVDSICGILRDSQKKGTWADEMVKKLLKNKIIRNLSK